MAEPSEYELRAWHGIQRFRGRPLSRALRNANEQVVDGAARIGRRAGRYLEKHPRARSAVSRGQEITAKGAGVVGSGARKAAGSLPDWGGDALTSVRRMVARASRVGLSPERVVRRHQKRGHEVGTLADLRGLDLELIDAVRGRGAGLYYPAAAALSGMGAGILITGGELVTVASAGASAAPSGAVVAGAFVADAAAVLGLASRAVGHVSLFYGYDPEEPGEKLFVMSVVNAGTAMSASAKTAAMADLSRLTQALVRGKTWKVLNASLVSRVYTRFLTAFGVRYTKQTLGKVVPAAGIVLGGSFNWATLESIVDAADVAYRRRFLVEKYPQLLVADAPTDAPAAPADASDVAPEPDDEAISVLAELAEEGGPEI